MSASEISAPQRQAPSVEQMPPPPLPQGAPHWSGPFETLLEAPLFGGYAVGVELLGVDGGWAWGQVGGL